MRKFLYLIASLLLLIAGGLAWLTTSEFMPFPHDLSLSHSKIRKAQVLDRNDTPLTITYQNQWNIHDYVPLHVIPEMLQRVFITAEDKRFYEHQGPDWAARWHAMFQNIKSLRVVRGASTITEQSVRILHPRPRTFWSRWVEGFEAQQLEAQFSKADILEFYLNQVPYAHQRRGVVQAARHYFDRDLDTLNLKEMMALAVLVRAPSRLDLKRGTKAIEKPIAYLAKKMFEDHQINQSDYESVLTTPLSLKDASLTVQASHFVNYIYDSQPVETLQTLGKLHTTLNGQLQNAVQYILDQRLINLKNRNVNNGAVLVVDHQKGEILAWVNAGVSSDKVAESYIDAITTPRQPGSTLKPLLYACALEKGWTAATLIDDYPLSEAVGVGLHSYRNYSRVYYGKLRLRDALGNSLNIPAIHAIQFVGTDYFLQKLRHLGFSTLTAHPNFYGDGLALGNGGVTLFDLVQAYTVLANRGRFTSLQTLRDNPYLQEKTVFDERITSIIANILSDPDARRLEFGRGALLRFPVQTSVKTGTSTDYRDAWALGFNHRYTVGVWLGNLDQQPMSQVSGASGPALILRAVFAELTRYKESEALYLSPQLVNIKICRETGMLATSHCASRDEWFIPGTEPTETLLTETESIPSPLYLRQPSANLQLAVDPRIPDDQEAFPFILAGDTQQGTLIEWLVDDEVIGTTPVDQTKFLWNLERGTHTAQAKLWLANTETPLETPMVEFVVK